MNENDILIAHMNDLASRAVKTGFVASKFLTPAESQSVSEYFLRRKDTTIIVDGGFEGAERARAVFMNPDWGEYKRANLFTALKAAHRPQDTLSHRDILGALMALGIERETIANISPSTVVKLTKGENVNTDVLVQICRALNCAFDDIVEILPENEDK